MTDERGPADADAVAFLKAWCFCACCCDFPDRTPWQRVDCTCRVRLPELREAFATASARLARALEAIEREVIGRTS